MLTITPTDAALGATVTDFDPRTDLDDETTETLRQALWHHEVLFFPELGLSPVDHAAFARAFGPLGDHEVLTTHEDAPDVVVFDTDAGMPIAEPWHTDVSCLPAPPSAAMLQIVITPPSGGSTYWASMTAAHDALDPDVKARIAGLGARHQAWWDPSLESVHPVVRTHPGTGRRSLFVNGVFTRDIVGVDEHESRELLAHLLDHAQRDEFVVRHDWKAGDIALWDECSTQHRVDNDFGTARRVGHRVVLAGAAPF